MQHDEFINKLTVGLGQRSYSINVGCDCLNSIGKSLTAIDFPRHVVVVSNTTVAPLYAQRVMFSLSTAGFVAELIEVADGENFKTAATLNDIYTKLLEFGCDRSSGIVALGGGVVGDMAGFAAATFMRGIQFAQVPTTLLAQVDSSVGGKTAINHPLGKNMIGAFYQPRYVLIDVATLATLTERDFIAGLAEVIKYGMIYDGDFFSWLEENIAVLLSQDREALVYAITRSCQIKAQIVEQDETENSIRAILNYGHTFGHAVEQLSGYGTFLHGEAVAIGMVVAAKLSCQLGRCSIDDVNRLITLLCNCGFVLKPPRFEIDKYVAVMCRDKKVKDGVLNVVLNYGIGNYEIRSLSNPLKTFSQIELYAGMLNK